MELKSILLFIVALISAYLSLFLVRGKRNYSNIVFAMFILSVGIWALGVSFFNISNDVSSALLIARFYYFAAAAIPAFFLLFSFTFPKDLKVRFFFQLISFLPFVLIAAACLLTNNFILLDVHLGSPKTVVLNTSGYLIYSTYFVVTLLLAYVNLIRSYIQNREDKELRSQLKLLIIGTIIPYLGGAFFNLILPWYTYQYIWIGPLFGLTVCFVVLYAILKHRLFDIKVITAEIFAFTLCLFILLRAIVTLDQQEEFINFGLFLFSIVMSYFLVRSVRKEIEAREKVEAVEKDLEQANVHLQELDQQKSEFVSLASHQLRGPLTAVKGYASMLLDDDFGPVKGEVRDAVDKIYKSTQDLVVVVGDYLDVSRIEQGRMQYDFSEFDMRDLIATIVTELRPNIERAKLTMDFDYDSTGDFALVADQGKIKQVIGNIIDNAIKYCPKGGIHIWLAHKPDNKILITISDTGVGIHPDVLPRLFEKFTRAPDASKTNIMGTGLGLYVARKMIEAHHGRIWAESPGQGMGSSFFIELSGKEVTTH